MVSLKQLYEWFATGKFPTEQQFQEQFKSFWHKSERIAMSYVLGLVDALNSKASKEELANATTNFKGYHTSFAELLLAYPQNENKKDFYAWVGSPYPGTVHKVFADKGAWTDTGEVPSQQEVNLVEYVKFEDLPHDIATQYLNKQQGFYNPDGTFNAYINNDYRGVELSIDDNDIVIVNAVTHGLATQLALYKDSNGNVIGSEQSGSGSTKILSNYKLSIPVGTTTICLTSYIKNNDPFEVYKKTLSELAKQKDVDEITNTIFEWSSIALHERQGFYRENGDLNEYTNNDFRCTELSVKDTYVIKVTGYVTGLASQLALYKDGVGNILGVERRGTTDMEYYKDYTLSLPIGTTTVCLSWSIKNNATLDCLLFKDNIIENTSDIYRIDDTLYNWTIKGLQVKQGFYRPDGTFNGYANNDFRGAELDVRQFLKVKVSASIAGSATQLALYKDSNGNVIGSEVQGVGSELIVVEDYELTIPDEATIVCLTWALRDNNTMGCYVYSNKQDYNVKLLDDRLKVVENTNTVWKDKNILWLGTSIPESGYPVIVGDLLGANIVNKALGGSKCRIGRKIPFEGQSPVDIYGVQGMGDNGVRRSLTRTLDEVQYIIDNWDALKPLIPSNTEMTEWAKNDMRGASFENSLLPYLDYDLFVFDHGYNDEIGLAIESTEDFLTMPDDKFDRNTYMGAVNFLINLILEHNPRAKFCFVGHYTDDNPWVQKNAVCKGQEILADYWNAPLLKLWEQTRWSQRKIKTTGSWTDKLTWNPTGSIERELTMTQIWMQDNLHPYSIPAQKHLAGFIANWLATIN